MYISDRYSGSRKKHYGRSYVRKIGIASMEIMYYVAGQLMKVGQPFILENNFEYSSEHGIKNLLEKYQYTALTITLTGDYKVIYQRFLERESSPDRHRGHVVNDCYPEKKRIILKLQKHPLFPMKTLFVE